MKKSSLLYAAIVAASVTATANAQSVINITGATAFREAAHRGILASINNCTYGYEGSNFFSASRAIFKGDIDVDGTPTQVIVRTSWSGAVAGIRAVTFSGTNSFPVSYFKTDITGLQGGNGTVLSATNNTTSENVSKICFSDNDQSNTPFTTPALAGSDVGVIAFVPVINENTVVPEFTSITTLQLRRLMEAGSAPLKFITGNFINGSNGTVSDGIRVYWTGRNSLSGTRAIYLSEAGVGASKPVIQYQVEPTSTNVTDAITALRIWPVENNDNGVDVWSPTAQTGNATAGNGGYNSGGLLGNLLQRTMNATVAIKNSAGGTDSTRTGNNTILLSVVSAQEISAIQAGGGRALAYNGVSINPDPYNAANQSGGITAADREKIVNGRYTFWSYEKLYYRDDQVDATDLAFIALLNTNVPNHIYGNGVKKSEMRVTRTSDGGKLSVSNSMQ